MKMEQQKNSVAVQIFADVIIFLFYKNSVFFFVFSLRFFGKRYMKQAKPICKHVSLILSFKILIASKILHV